MTAGTQILIRGGEERQPCKWQQEHKSWFEGERNGEQTSEDNLFKNEGFQKEGVKRIQNYSKNLILANLNIAQSRMEELLVYEQSRMEEEDLLLRAEWKRKISSSEQNGRGRSPPWRTEQNRRGRSPPWRIEQNGRGRSPHWWRTEQYGRGRSPRWRTLKTHQIRGGLILIIISQLKTTRNKIRGGDQQTRKITSPKQRGL